MKHSGRKGGFVLFLGVWGYICVFLGVGRFESRRAWDMLCMMRRSGILCWV